MDRTEVPQASPGESSGWRWDAGIDWVTYISRTRHAVAAIEGLGQQLRREHIEPSAKERPFNLCGYSGWQTSALRVGRRGHCAMMQLSGELASRCYTELRPYGGQPTRLDVQVTLELSQPQPRFGRRFLRPTRATKTSPPSTRPPTGLSTDSRGLFLGTVGARTSSRYLRLYDKGIELGTQPAGVLWRAELEAKGRLAQAMWAQLGSVENVRRWCYDSVADNWQRSGYGWPLSGPSQDAHGCRVPTAPPPDSQRLLRWLSMSVAPVIRRLLAQYSPEHLAWILGLPYPSDDASGSETDAA